MKNITVAIPEGAWHDARVWAVEHGTSLSQVVAFFLKTLPDRKLPAKRYPLVRTTPHPPIASKNGL